MEVSRRALHFVFKVADRKSTIHFYKNVLGMQVLRHEEFEKGCEAFCNGPYDGKWSKTMIGYGPESSHFVVELTYNYGIGYYQLGNDFSGLYIHSTKVIENAERLNWPVSMEGSHHVLEAPGGYKFYVSKEEPKATSDPVYKVELNVSNITTSINYWSKLLRMKIVQQSDGHVELAYQDSFRLALRDVGKPVDHAKAFGRIAFSCPASDLAGIEATVKEAGHTILTPLISLDTPGKATVQVVILQDPDGHEICFVGDEAFRELSQVDPKADDLLSQAIEKDKSDEWFSKKGMSKEAA